MGQVCRSQVAICSAVNMVDWVGAELGGEGRGGKGDNCNNGTITPVSELVTH